MLIIRRSALGSVYRALPLLHDPLSQLPQHSTLSATHPGCTAELAEKLAGPIPLDQQQPHQQ